MRRNAQVERKFQRIADEMIRRTERIQCTLEQRQLGLRIVINSLQTESIPFVVENR